MAAQSIPIGYGRTGLPGSPKEHAQQFLTLLLHTFFTKRDSLWVTEDPRLIVGTAQLTAQVPIVIPSGYWQKEVGETVYRKLTSKTIPSEPVEWTTGIEEELKRMKAPDYVGLSFGKAPEHEAESALELLEETAIDQLVVKGQTTAHPYDGVNFLSTSARPIHPLKDGSPTYVNKKVIPAGYTGFSDIRKHFWGLPRPSGKGKLNLEPDLIICANDNYDTWEDVQMKDEITINVETGGGETRPSKEKNKHKGKFRLVRSSYMPDGGSLVFGKGAAAGVPYIVHVLSGVEQLPNGDIRAPQNWEQLKGNPMMPKFKYFGEGDPIVERTGKVQIKGEMAFQVTPMCPWNVLFCTAT